MGKIKLFLENEKGKNILIVSIVILVGLGSFELGRLSKGANSGGIKVEYPNPTETQTANVISTTKSSNILQNNKILKTSNLNSTPNPKNFFASNRGNKYYPIGCSAGKTIKQENRVYFTTGEEAQKAGYELSGSCN